MNGAEPDPASVESFRAARTALLARIAGACERVHREPGEVTLVAVTKTVEVARIRAAAAAGFERFGENRVQEAQAKIGELEGLGSTVGSDIRWHLIGHLQANKARAAVELFDLIQSVDSPDLARRIDRLARELRPGRRLPVLLQVNVDQDPSKTGFDPDAIGEALPELQKLEGLEIAGLMTVGRLVERAEDARPTFVRLRRLSESLRAKEPAVGPQLSMGMTDDFEVAVEEGATIVRVGRAIFGERPASG